MIIKNTNESAVEEITMALKANEGYCPCKLTHISDNKCMCKEFREQNSGWCSCGLYKKVLENEN